MKRERVLWGFSGSLVLFFLLIGNHYHQTHKIIFDKYYAEYIALKSSEEAMKRDLLFLKQHEKEWNLLEEKGWFKPKSRLVTGECIEGLSKSLHKVDYVFEPEVIKNLGEKYSFSTTQVVIEVEGLFDTDIYNFVEMLFEKFSGILKVRELTLMRKQNFSDNSLIDYPDVVLGKIVLEWFSMRKEDDEK
ncbi:MAG: hypothetical protein JSR85_07165 [Proteobacteria bacterium]|nr:hypothetical protein [Pseudomonadota bacterium]